MNKILKDSQDNQQIINRNDEIDFTAVFHVLIQRQWTIYIITSIFTAIGIIYALTATPYYESKISLYPAGSLAENSSGIGGGIRGFAESFGIGGIGSAAP